MDFVFSAFTNLARTVFGAWPLPTTVALTVVGVCLILTGGAARVGLMIETVLVRRHGSSAFLN